MGELTKRLFLAIELDEIHRQCISEFVDVNHELNLRWVKPENWHVTALFLGNIPSDELDIVIEKVNQLLNSFSSFDLKAERFLFMPPSRPRMLWLKFENNRAFSNLNVILSKALLGTDPDRPAKAHVTLSRFKYAPKKHMLSVPLPEVSLHVNRLVLFESQLSNVGAEYHKLKTWELT